MSPYILHIETSTQICSVALSKGTELLTFKTVADRNVHSELLTIFIQEILQEAKVEISNLDAISVSKGPGSFTGLRIGVAVAKGICYGANIPLIGVHTLKSLAINIPDLYKTESHLVLPLLDARNGEVYTAIYDHKSNEIKTTEIGRFEFESYQNLAKNKTLVIIGDEVEKWAGSYENTHHTILIKNLFPDARNLIKLAAYHYNKNAFENITFFEPLYLRDFKAKVGTKIKNILNS